MYTLDNIKTIKTATEELLRSHGFDPRSASAYEVWIRWFDDSPNDILESLNQPNTSILDWINELALHNTEPDYNPADRNTRALARRWINKLKLNHPKY